MAKKNVQAVQKVAGVLKESPKKAQKALQKPVVAKLKKEANQDKEFFKKITKQTKKAELKKKVVEESEEDEHEDVEEDEEDSGADVVAEEEEDEDDDVEQDEDDDEDDDDDGEDDEEEAENGVEASDSDDAPQEAAIKKTAPEIEKAPKKKQKTPAEPKEKKKKEEKKGAERKEIPADDCTVVMKNFGDNIKDVDIEKLFSKYGIVDKITLRKDKGFCFVAFKSADSAKDALKAHNSQFNNSVISVYPKVKNPKELFVRDPKKTVLVKNVEKLTTISANDLTPIFEKYGEIIELQIICGKNVLAFVTYKNAESAEKCLELDGKTINNIKLDVSAYQALNNLKTTIFVQNVKPGVTKEEIEELFSQSGPIDNTFIKSGFAIVKFKDTESFCKSFLLNETLLRGQMIFLEPHSLKKQFALRNKNFPAQKRPNPNFKGNSHQKRFKKN